MVPSLEARAYVAPKLPFGTATLGLSGHYGREHVSVGTTDIWAAVLDLNVTVAEKVTVKGEAFYGANLDGFSSNASICGPDPKQATPGRGGWLQIAYRPGKLGLMVGAGMDNPIAPSGVTFANGTVTSNAAVYAAVTWTFAPKFVAGVEYDWLMTERVATPTRTAHYTNLSLQVGF